MLHSFFNNAQKEKSVILDYCLDHNNNIVDALPHRIKAINDDLETIGILLTINNNLTYTVHESAVNYSSKLTSYYKKEIRYQYTKFLIHQSTLFQLVKYIACKGPVPIQEVINELNISTSYIYKLVGAFNTKQADIMKIKLKIKHKSIDFEGSLVNVAVFIFSLSKYLPDTERYSSEELLKKPFDVDNPYTKAFMPYLELLFDYKITGKELIVAILTRTTSDPSTPDQLKLIGYRLIRKGGMLVDLCYALLEVLRPKYPQLQINDTSLYVVEMLKVLTLIKTFPNDLLFHNRDSFLQIKYYPSIEEDLNQVNKLIPMTSNTIYTQEDLKELLLFIYPFLEQTKPQPKLNIFIELVDSFFISQLFCDSIKATLNEEAIEFVTDPAMADLILTDNHQYICNKSSHTFAYSINDYIKEFEDKNYIKFILDIIEARRHLSKEQINYNASGITNGCIMFE